MKKRFLFYLFLLYFLLIYFDFVLAFPVSPADYYFDYIPGHVYTEQIRVGNKGEKDLNVILFVEGEFNESVKLIETSGFISPGERKSFPFEFTVPDTKMPGLHYIYLNIKETDPSFEQGGTGLAAVVAVAIPIQFRVPYPGKYLTASLYAEDVALGENVNFKLVLTSYGEEDLNGVFGDINIYDANGIFIDSVKTNSVDVFTGKGSIEVFSSWSSVGNNIGLYDSNATVYYADKITKAHDSFRIGDEIIEIINISGTSMKSGQINCLEVSAESKWNEPIPDVYAQLDFLTNDKKFTSEKITFGPWAKNNLYIYMHTDELDRGEYDARVSLFYLNKSVEKEIKIHIEKGFQINSQIVLIVVIVVLFAFNIWYFLKKKRKK